MTLEEAIQHLDEVLSDKDRWEGCTECMNEHKQLKEWLIELKQYKDIGTISKFRELNK